MDLVIEQNTETNTYSFIINSKNIETCINELYNKLLNNDDKITDNKFKNLFLKIITNNTFYNEKQSIIENIIRNYNTEQSTKIIYYICLICYINISNIIFNTKTEINKQEDSVENTINIKTKLKNDKKNYLSVLKNNSTFFKYYSICLILYKYIKFKLEKKIFQDKKRTILLTTIYIDEDAIDLFKENLKNNDTINSNIYIIKLLNNIQNINNIINNLKSITIEMSLNNKTTGGNKNKKTKHRHRKNKRQTKRQTKRRTKTPKK